MSTIKEEMESAKKDVEGLGVKTDKLYIVYYGAGDSLLGEVLIDPSAGQRVTLISPRRILRMQQASNGGLIINFVLGHFDLMEGGGGIIDVLPTVVWKVDMQPPVMQLNVYSLLLDFLEKEKLRTATEAGLILPNPAAVRSPFKRNP